MTNAAAWETPSLSGWLPPLVPQQYDCSPLSAAEREAIAVLAHMTHGLGGKSQTARHLRHALARLLQPVTDVFTLFYPDCDLVHAHKAARVLIEEMHRRGEAFWQWSPAVWLTLLDLSQSSMHGHRLHAFLMLFAYLLCDVRDLRTVGLAANAERMAHAVFGAAVVETVTQRVMDELYGRSALGYRAGQHILKNRLHMVLLLNRSPYLEHITPESLTMGREGAWTGAAAAVYRIERALQRLQILPAPVQHMPALHLYPEFREGAGDEWYAWCVAWVQRTDLELETKQGVFTNLLCVGRWLKARYPDVTSPHQWDENLAFAFKTDVQTWQYGQYASAKGSEITRRLGRRGQAMGAAGIDGYLYSIRRFFTDLHNSAHGIPGGEPHRLPIRFVPAHAFKTPRRIARQLQQAQPRDIDMLQWARLVTSAAVLAGSASTDKWYPLSLWRAMALLWTTTARRPNELLRLRKDCVRRAWQPDMRDDSGRLVPVPSVKLFAAGEQSHDGDVAKEGSMICYLHVPSGKNREGFWIWIPDYVADAIDAWLKERPEDQPALLDPRDRAYVEYLFQMRGEQVGTRFINLSLIPALCKKANVPLHDAKGRITGHRGRSSRATFLRKVGVSLDDLAEYLGHANSHTIRRYAATDPIQLHRTIEQADDLSRIVRGYIDLEAAGLGHPALRWFIGYDVDGEPMYCANQAYITCPHRLDCPKCGMFIGGARARQLHAGEHALPIEAKVPMTPIEQCLVAADQEGYAAEQAKLARQPPPIAPSHSVIFNAEGLREAEWRTLADDGTPESLQILEAARATHEARLAAELQRYPGHNVRASAMRRKITQLDECISLWKERVADRTTVLPVVVS